MASPLPTTGSTSGPPSPATRIIPERSMPTRVSAEGPRSGDGDTASGGGRSRAGRHDESERGAEASDDDGDVEESKVDNENTRRGPLSADEFDLISVPLDTWVGRYVRITTPRHNGTTGLVHRTGNGWVNLQTALGDVAKRAYDLVVIPEERANITAGSGMEKVDPARGGPASMGSNSGSGDERRATAGRARTSRPHVSTTHSSSDSSGQDDNDEEGDIHDSGRSNRRRGRAAMDDGSDFDDGDEGDEDDEDGDNDDDRYDDDSRMRNNARGGRPFSGPSKNRAMTKGGGREKGERYGGAEPVKSSGRMSITYTRRDNGGGGGKPRSRVADQDKMKERDRGRERGESVKGGLSRERDGAKGDSFVSIGRNKEKDADAGGSRGKRRDLAFLAAAAAAGDSEDKHPSVISSRERVDRSKDKSGTTSAGKKDEAVIKSSWAAQMQKAKERPNLVHWRDELVAITKDSSEDFEDATFSVELMRMQCDVCYHEKSDGDKFCWNEQCWLSPVFAGYFKIDEDAPSKSNPVAPQRAGYINTFGRETIIDSALTSALQAPVKWLETKRKRKLEAHEVFSEDPALYRWQCWASNFQDPNSKDPTFVEDPRFGISDNKRPRGSYSSQSLSESKRGARSHEHDFSDSEHGSRMGTGSSMHGGGPDGVDSPLSHLPEGTMSRRVRHVRPDVHLKGDRHAMDARVDEGDEVHMEVAGRHSVSHGGDAVGGRLWS